jgi:hypothetical protein
LPVSAFQKTIYVARAAHAEEGTSIKKDNLKLFIKCVKGLIPVGYSLLPSTNGKDEYFRR